MPRKPLSSRGLSGCAPLAATETTWLPLAAPPRRPMEGGGPPGWGTAARPRVQRRHPSDPFPCGLRGRTAPVSFERPPTVTARE